MGKYQQLDYKCDVKKFNECFAKYKSDVPYRLEPGEKYVSIDNNKFVIWQYPGFRNIRWLFNEKLIGEICSDGNVKYKYKRADETILLTLAAPLLFMFVSIIFGIAFGDTELLGIAMFPLILISPNLICPKRLRKELFCTLQAIALQSKEEN